MKILGTVLDLAQGMEKDFNHYLTSTATEYVPDTDRMLFMVGFAGIGFKKGFHDPIKRRPMIASISALVMSPPNPVSSLNVARNAS